MHVLSRNCMASTFSWMWGLLSCFCANLWISLDTTSTCRSLWRSLFLMYQGALTMCLDTFFWNRCIMSITSFGATLELDTVCPNGFWDSAVGMWEAIKHWILWRRFTLLSLCLRHVISREALVGSRASTPLKFLLSHTFRETWRTCRALFRRYQLFPEMEEMLIEKVRQRTILYDTESPDYRDQHMRANAWEGIGKELKIKRFMWAHVTWRYCVPGLTTECDAQPFVPGNRHCAGSQFGPSRPPHSATLPYVTKLNHVAHPSSEANLRSAVQEFPSIFIKLECWSPCSLQTDNCASPKFRKIQSTPSNLIPWEYILLLSSHLRLDLPSSHLRAGFPTKILQASLFSTTRAIPYCTIWWPQIISWVLEIINP